MFQQREALMNIRDYIAIYRRGRLTRLNASLVGLTSAKLVFVLRELELRGFEIRKFIDADLAGNRWLGIAVSGPSMPDPHDLDPKFR
jgi:hypothetical protein